MRRVYRMHDRPVAAPAPAASPVQPAPVTPPAPEPAAPVVSEPVVALVPAAGESKVHLQFTADCWTQLTDATEMLHSLSEDRLPHRPDRTDQVRRPLPVVRGSHPRDVRVIPRSRDFH